MTYIMYFEANDAKDEEIQKFLTSGEQFVWRA
jgi:hypothetical protein